MDAQRSVRSILFARSVCSKHSPTALQDGEPLRQLLRNAGGQEFDYVNMEVWQEYPMPGAQTYFEQCNQAPQPTPLRE